MIHAVASGAGEQLLVLAAESGGGSGLTVNVFWIIIAALNFIVFFLFAYRLILMPVGARLADRRDRIEQGLKDADAARRDREAAADQRQGILNEARREAGDIVQRAQKVADDERAKGIVQTQVQIDRMRERAVAEIDAERKRALADVRSQVAELALMAAGKVVGETMNAEREQRLVDEFVTQVSAQPLSGNDRN